MREKAMELVMVIRQLPMELSPRDSCRRNPFTVHDHTIYTRVSTGIIVRTLIIHTLTETTCIGLLQN